MLLFKRIGSWNLWTKTGKFNASSICSICISTIIAQVVEDFPLFGLCTPISINVDNYGKSKMVDLDTGVC